MSLNIKSRLAFLLVVAPALIPYQGPHSSSGGIRLASGQGLSVSADNLGAGAEATANEFEQFESALELATTGGRGRCGGMIALQQCCGLHSYRAVYAVTAGGSGSVSLYPRAVGGAANCNACSCAQGASCRSQLLQRVALLAVLLRSVALL